MIETLAIETGINFKTDFIDYQKLPEMKKLFLDFLEHKQPAQKYYKWDYRNPDDYRSLSDSLLERKYPRQKLADILWETNRGFGCSDSIKDNIDRFSDPESMVVIAGQQVGIFGGPVLTFYKAAGVVRMAAKLSEELSKPVVPMFWMATEDHDYDEANTIRLVNKKGEPVDIVNEPHNGQRGKSMSQIQLDEGISTAVDELEDVLIPTEFTEPLFSLLRDFYRPGELISSAFAKWLTSLLCDYGLVLVDPSNPDFKKLVAPIYEREISRPFDSDAPDQFSADERITRDGYHLQVRQYKNGINLFYSHPHRDKILLDEDGELFKLENSGEVISRSGMNDLLRDKPESFSSGVLLRPLVQSKLLPTVGFLGGSSEISYHAQLIESYKYFDVEPPVICPRPSISLIGKRVNSILNKYEIKLPELFQDHHKVINDVLAEFFPADLESKLDNVRNEIDGLLESVTSEIGSYDEGLQKTFKTSTNKIGGELNKLKGKMFQAHKKKNSEVTNQITKAYESLFPGGTMQERVLPMIYFLNKYSPAFAGKLFREIDIDKNQHQIIYISAS